MKTSLNRREFMRQTAALSGALAASYHVHPAPAAPSSSANEKLRLAAIGTMNRAGANLAAVAGENIVALCDVDENLLAKAAAKYPSARKYRDFRVMLEKEADKIDAVLVATPDHTHAPAGAMALRLKKHLYCEKPLTHTVFEARTLADLARTQKLVTQMGTQIHADDNYRRVVELIQTGAVGAVREVHVWVPQSYGGARFNTDEPAPGHLDWDLWLGPAAARPYSRGVHPFRWRRFWEYGTGGLGDFGCHYMDLAHWALKLRHPTTIAAEGPPLDPVGTPAWLIVRYDYSARGELPPVQLTWYDGGRRPELLAQLRDKEGKPLAWRAGQLFVGEHGMLLSDYTRHVLLPVEKFADFKPPAPFIPASIGHHQEWLQAIRSGGTTTCNFDYSGALAEAALLGNVAYRSGKRITWDAEKLRVTNAPEAQQFVHKEYRKGWTL
jgi:predicted dehydrogenase